MGPFLTGNENVKSLKKECLKYIPKIKIYKYSLLPYLIFPIPHYRSNSWRSDRCFIICKPVFDGAREEDVKETIEEVYPSEAIILCIFNNDIILPL